MIIITTDTIIFYFVMLTLKFVLFLYYSRTLDVIFSINIVLIIVFECCRIMVLFIITAVAVVTEIIIVNDDTVLFCCR